MFVTIIMMKWGDDFDLSLQYQHNWWTWHVNLDTFEDGQDISDIHYSDACADDNDRDDDSMSPHLPLLIELLNLNTLERADLRMYRWLLDITNEEEENEEDKDKEEYQSDCFNL